MFSLGDFVIESLFGAQRLLILNLFSADTEIWASRFDSQTKRLQFRDVSNVVCFIANSRYFCERTLPSIASNNDVIV